MGRQPAKESRDSRSDIADMIDQQHARGEWSVAFPGGGGVVASLDGERHASEELNRDDDK